MYVPLQKHANKVKVHANGNICIGILQDSSKIFTYLQILSLNFHTYLDCPRYV